MDQLIRLSQPSFPSANTETSCIDQERQRFIRSLDNSRDKRTIERFARKSDFCLATEDLFPSVFPHTLGNGVNYFELFVAN